MTSQLERLVAYDIIWLPSERARARHARRVALETHALKWVLMAGADGGARTDAGFSSAAQLLPVLATASPAMWRHLEVRKR